MLKMSISEMVTLLGGRDSLSQSLHHIPNSIGKVILHLTSLNTCVQQVQHTCSDTGGSENLTLRLPPEEPGVSAIKVGRDPALFKMDPEGDALLGDGTNFCQGSRARPALGVSSGS